MTVHQFYDKGLAHASYSIISENEMAVIDPARDPQPYYDYARKHNATINTVIETHPHADFISSHLEIANTTGAKIYVSKLLGAEYPHQTFDNGDEIKLGKAILKALNTPGHSPDSISILLIDENGKEHALFTGDTLFVGDVGRPDLRETVGNITAAREQLAKAMYHTTRNVLLPLNDEILVYPAHGPGSLCGKTTSPDLFSTIGREKKENYALQPMDESAFVKTLLEDQPFIPKYFGHDVTTNKAGASAFEESINTVPRIAADAELDAHTLVIDTRPQLQYKKGHLRNSINIQQGLRFETWLGSIVAPGEKFYLIAENEKELESVIRKTAKIGYERNIKGALLPPPDMTEQSPVFDPTGLSEHLDDYTIVDIRNAGEGKQKIFDSAIHIPLPELRERVSEIPLNKPILVHCAGGYRSSAGCSIIEKQTGIKVLDLSDAVKDFDKVKSA